MPLVGAIDGFKSTVSFHGWFSNKVKGQNQSFSVEIEVGGRVVASTTYISLTQKAEGKTVFNIELNEPLSASAILNEEAVAFLISEIGRIGELGFYKPMIDRLRHVEFAEMASHTPEDIFLQLLNTMSGGERTELKKKLARFVQNASVAQSGMMLPGIETDIVETSLVRLRPGQLSHDGSVVVGKQGYLFLIGGTNHVLQQYGNTEAKEADISLAEDWIKIFSERRRNSQAMSFQYIQIIIPEKISALPDLFPVAIRTPGVVLQEIERGIESYSDLLNCYVSCLQLFNSFGSMHGFFRQIDTHFSPEGCLVLMRALVEKVGNNLDRNFSFEGRHFRRGDLATKFDGIEMYDQVSLVAQNSISDWEIGLKRVSHDKVGDDKHIGTKVVWKNQSAPIKKKLVVFGNSFFQVGDSPDILSWWCARFFEEFHFVWSPDLDYNYIEKAKPDIVICQTIERFLSRVPLQ